MSIGLVIFSRMDSNRLPGKALKTFAGRALLGHVIDRAKATRNADLVIVATSDRGTDDKIAAYAEAQGAEVFRGSAHDVLGRAVGCAEAFGLTVLGRICGDSPFIAPQMLGRPERGRPHPGRSQSGCRSATYSGRPAPPRSRPGRQCPVFSGRPFGRQYKGLDRRRTGPHFTKNQPRPV